MRCGAADARELLSSDVGYSNLLAGAEATATLMRGFTTVRDMGGPAFGLKRAIDEGLVPGPRIYPSGAVITVTSGHGDFRQLSDLPRTSAECSAVSSSSAAAMIADSPDEVRLRVREQLMQGASQIKLTAGGGVASPFSPLDVPPSPRPNFARRSKRPRTGEPMSPCMPTRRSRSSGRSRPASSASSTAI